jgi:N-acetyl-gamma-glutamyl-phosphate reductase
MHKDSDKVRVSILGASGYSGGELVKILSRHSLVQLDGLFANKSAGSSVRSLYPWFGGAKNATFEAYSPELVAASDIVFLALPSGEAMNLAPTLIAQGKKVIDLGGDFRLHDSKEYSNYYHCEHSAKSLLKEAVYGIPEWNATAITNAKLVANPGCYPTSVILPLAPLLKERLIESGNITINSLSGVSGAGRKASLDLSFSEINDSVKAYKIGNHQHIPEIQLALNTLSGVEPSFTFIPHLIPITRGIFTTITADLTKGTSLAKIEAAYESYYGDAPFVRFALGAMPEIKHVTNTNFISIGFSEYAKSGKLVIHSAIDNLIKGAAGQAVQNMNLMFGFTECEALR